MPSTSRQSHSHWEVVAAFVFGCVFLLAVLAIAFFKPNPTPFEYTVFRIVIALAAAGIGAILPGFLDVSFKKWLRAGGALGLFVVVYFFAPATLGAIEETKIVEPQTAAKGDSDRWLRDVDEGRFNDAYESMAASFRSKYPFEEFDQLVGRERRILGEASDRLMISTAPFESPPGAAKGAYRQYVYRTKFKNEAKQLYELVWLLGEEDDWRVVGYYTVVKNELGQYIPYETPVAITSPPP